MSQNDSIEERLAALEQQYAALATENAELRTQLAAQVDGQVLVATPDVTTKVSRRQALVRLGGVAAVAGVAATAAGFATNVENAHAADGGSLVLGALNQSTKETDLSDDGTNNSLATLMVTANGKSINGSGTAIDGESGIGGIGVLGNGYDDTTNNLLGLGVLGNSPNGDGTGVIGNSNTGFGVAGIAVSGVGVAGIASTGWDLVALGNGRIFQAETITHVGPPVALDGEFSVAELIRDSSAMLWTSVLDPSNQLRWVRPGVVNGGAAGGALNFLPSPVRLIGAGSPPGVALAKNTRTNFTLAGSAGIPSDAKAVFGNATVYGAGGSGFVTLTPKGGSASTSSLNFTGSDQPLSNFVAVGLNGGAITVVVSNNFNVKFIYDVVGYCL